MTLRLKLYLILGHTFLLLIIFQYLTLRYQFIEYNLGYITYLFVIGTSLIFLALAVVLIEFFLLSKFHHLGRSIPNIIRLFEGLVHHSETGKDKIPQFTDQFLQKLEEMKIPGDNLKNSQDTLTVDKKFSSVGSWDLDLKTGKVRCSEEMYRITGLEANNIGSNYAFMANIIHPEDRQTVKKTLQTALLENTLCSIDYRAIVPGGSQRPLHAEGEVHYDKDNQLFNITGVLYDISRQRTLEELELINKEQGFSILDVNPNPVFVIDNNMKVQYLNEAFVKSTGYSAEDVLGTKPPYPWWPEDLHEQYTRQLSREMRGRIKKSTCQYKKSNGRSIWFEVTPRSLLDDKAGYYFMYLTDITGQRRIEQNKQFFLSEITRAQEEERKRIALEIHDDIIQDIASLSLEIDALGKDKNRLRDDLPETLQTLRNEVQDAVKKLRLLSHQLHPSVIDQGLIPALETLVQETSKGPDLNIQFITQGDEQQLPAEVAINLFRIAQEAINNVTKHSGATEATIKLRYTSRSVKLMVYDSGLGFEFPEQWGDFASKQKLGIIGMQERANIIRGKFTLKSRVGKGTVVMVEVAI